MKAKHIASLLLAGALLAGGIFSFTAKAEDKAAVTSVPVKMGRMIGIKGKDIMDKVLKEKLSMSDTEIAEARAQKKNIFDIAQAKGVSKEDLKKALLDEKFKAIDKAVTDGKITKAEGDSLKAKIQERMNNCDGNLGKNFHKKGSGKGQGMGKGRNGGGGNSGNCTLNNQ